MVQKSPHGCDAMEIEVEENFGWICGAILKNSTMKISDTRSYRWMDLGREPKSPHGCDAMRAEVLCSYFKNLRYYSTKCQ